MYWQRCIGAIHIFVNSQDKATLKVLPLTSIRIKDLFLRVKKMMGPIVDLITAMRDLDEAQEDESSASPKTEVNKLEFNFAHT